MTLRQDLAASAGADAAALLPTGSALVATHDWTFLLGPGLIPAINALCPGYVLYRSRLVPRIIPALGLIGAPLLAISVTATLFGIYDQVSVFAVIAVLPIALWELSLGIWLVAKGFDPRRWPGWGGAQTTRSASVCLLVSDRQRGAPVADQPKGRAVRRALGGEGRARMLIVRS